jgi:hypothetical protein
MRSNILAACGVLVVAGLTVSAQTPQTQPQPSTPSTPKTRSMDAAGSVTVTGCLAAWDGKATAGPADSASSSSSASAKGASTAGTKYVLTHVQEGSGASTSGSSSVPATYLLKADSSVDLNAHLNHKVQITGSVDKSTRAHSGDMSASGQPSTALPGTPNPTDPPSDNPATASGASRAHDMGSMKPATFKVTSVAMVSATCP